MYILGEHNEHSHSMKKLKLYIATSLNGYIAKSNHSVEWLDKIPVPEGEDYGYVDFYNSCGVTLMGNNTYKFILNSGHEFPYTTTDNYVITRDKNLESNADVTFIRENHVEFVKNLKSEDGKNIWLIGGGQLNTMCLVHKLIDEIWIHIMPIILEDGIKLTEALCKDVLLDLISSKAYSSGVVEVKYKVRSS